MHIAVCVATYQRPDMLARLLDELAVQETAGAFSYSVVIADNDANGSAKGLVTGRVSTYPVALHYCHEPRRSIAHVRNKSLAESSGDLIAFIDDDEFPTRTWLLALFRALGAHTCAGVLGPVRPHYPDGTPSWVIRAGFFDRPEHPTGYVLPWTGCRTGNVLFKREIVAGLTTAFSPEFGTGGSDVDFFRRMIGQGHRFVWCNEAAVFETVPPNRWQRSILLKRALLRGQNSFRYARGSFQAVGKALVAVPLYIIALPFLLLTSHHLFMRYLVRLCDHLGRLLAALGIKPIKQRAM